MVDCLEASDASMSGSLAQSDFPHHVEVRWRIRKARGVLQHNLLILALVHNHPFFLRILVDEVVQVELFIEDDVGGRSFDNWVD